MSFIFNNTVSIDATNLDAFGRLRTSEAFTLADYKHTYALSPDFINVTTNGGTVVLSGNSSAYINTSSATNSTAIHQTRMYHNYQPGKSQLIFSSVKVGASVSNVTKRTGYYDANNGVYFEQAGDGTLSFCIRSDLGGSISDARKITQANWNINTCNTTITGADSAAVNYGLAGSFNLDISKAIILFFDLEWLGVGRVRCGFVHNGQYVVAHEFYNDNLFTSPYMRTGSLPVRCETFNTGSTTGGSLEQICSSVISEGGYAESGRNWGLISTGAQQINGLSNTYPIMAVRLKNTFNGYPNKGFIRLENIALFANTNSIAYQVLKLPDISALTLANSTWVSVAANSIVEYNESATAYSDGESLFNGFVSATIGGAGAIAYNNPGIGPANNLLNAKKNFITQNYDSSNSEIYLLVATTLEGTANVWTGFQWREIY